MKKHLLIPIILIPIILMGCLNTKKNSGAPYQQPPSVVPPPVSQNEEVEGGISAGGGGTLPVNSINKYQVYKVMENAKILLRSFINHEQYYSYHKQLDSEKFLFGEKNLATQLEMTDIEILDDKPCLDKFGREVDASIHASRPNTICLSAHRIAPKLIEETAYKEILALIAHELSHFLGATEKEAVELQKWFVIRLRDLSFKEADSIESILWDYPTFVESDLSMKSYQVLDTVKSGNLGKSEEEIHDLRKALFEYDLFPKLQNVPMLRFIDYTIKNYEDIILTKLGLASIYVKTVISDEKTTYQRQYDECFKRRAEIKVSEIPSNCSFSLENNIYPNYLFKKLNSTADLLAEFKEVSQYVSDLSKRIRAIAFNQPIPFFHLPNNQVQNPWEKFVGKYEAKFLDCTTDQGNKDSFEYQKGIHAIEIFSAPTNDNDATPVLYMKEYDSYGFVSNSIYNGSYAFNGTMKLYEEGQSAVLTSESGTRWYDRQGRGNTLKTIKISKLNDTDFLLNYKNNYFRYDWRGITQSNSECKFSLTKIH